MPLSSSIKVFLFWLLQIFILLWRLPNTSGNSIKLGCFSPVNGFLTFLDLARDPKNSPAMWESWVLSLGWEDSPGEGKGYPLQYSGLENSMDCTVHGVTKSQKQLSEFHFLGTLRGLRNFFFLYSCKPKVLTTTPLLPVSHFTPHCTSGIQRS